LLFSLNIPENKALKSYDTSRKVMAWVYLTLGLINFGQLFLDQTQGDDDFFFQTISGIYIIIASFQALLLTYSLITLIDAYYVNRKRSILQLIPIIILSSLIFVGFFIHNISYLKSVIYVFSSYYLFQLIFYSRLFFLKARQLKADADNFFSENEIRRIQWVKTAFLASLLVGLCAFYIVLFPHAIHVEQVFSISYILFYLYFGIQFINYVPTFHVLRPIIAPEDKPLVAEEISTSISMCDLPDKLEKWIAAKCYKQCGITINKVAEQLNTNRTYISNFINSTEKMNFNRWLNSLRIEEAKVMLRSNKDILLSDLADDLGYTDQSCFSKQFKMKEGQTPLNWRKENLD